MNIRFFIRFSTMIVNDGTSSLKCKYEIGVKKRPTFLLIESNKNLYDLFVTPESIFLIKNIIYISIEKWKKKTQNSNPFPVVRTMYEWWIDKSNIKGATESNMDTLVNWIACMMISINDTDCVVVLFCVATSIKWHEIAENQWCLLCTRHYAMHNNNHHCANVSNAIQKPKVGSGQCIIAPYNSFVCLRVRITCLTSLCHHPHISIGKLLLKIFIVFIIIIIIHSKHKTPKHPNTHAHYTVGTLSLPLNDNTQHENFINGTGIW